MTALETICTQSFNKVQQKGLRVMEIIFAYFRFGELDSVCEGFDNFAASERYLSSRRWNEPIHVVSFIGNTLEQAWDALDNFIAAE